MAFRRKYRFRRFRRRRPQWRKWRRSRRLFKRRSSYHRRLAWRTGRWLKVPWALARDFTTTSPDPAVASGVTANGHLNELLTDFPPLKEDNAIDEYDRARTSQRIKLVSYRLEFTIFWPVIDANSDVTKVRIVFFLGRTNLNTGDIVPYLPVDGPKQFGEGVLLEQGAAAGNEYRQNWYRPFIKKIYYDRVFRRPNTVNYDQEARYRIKVRLPVYGLRVQYGMYDDDYDHPTNQQLYMLMVSNESVGPLSLGEGMYIKRLERRVQWIEGKPAFGTPVFETAPVKAMESEERLVPQVDDERIESIVSQMTSDAPASTQTGVEVLATAHEVV